MLEDLYGVGFLLTVIFSTIWQSVLLSDVSAGVLVSGLCRPMLACQLAMIYQLYFNGISLGTC